MAADLHKYRETWMSPVVPVSDMPHHYGVVVYQNYLFVKTQSSLHHIKNLILSLLYKVLESLAELASVGILSCGLVRDCTLAFFIRLLVFSCAAVHA